SAWADSVVSSDYEWRALMIAGDDSINNFDNGRKDLGSLFNEMGLLSSNQIHLSSMRREQIAGVRAATLDNIAEGFADLSVAHNTTRTQRACLAHMTSHGIRNGGFYLSMERRSALTSQDLSTLVNEYCGDQPTVILISACFSGQFITEELKGPNRVIMTAAIHDRPSFGCSPDYENTFWDNCLLSEIPNSETWTELGVRVNSCIERREAELGVRPSLPQVFIGENMVESRILMD
ncbi:MAG: hypothetical protein CL677_08160, partial [Bdellovibrionaceae bacterium]|nr:hypothetical protein [Pseudobdellovibrionaceae bacterium]